MPNNKLRRFKGAEGRTLFGYKLPTDRLDLSITTSGDRDFKIELPEESALQLRDWLNEVFPIVPGNPEYEWRPGHGPDTGTVG